MPALVFPLTFDRTFQLWSYNVSHSVLLLRSTQTATTPTRVDLMFRGVQEMRLRSRLDNVEITVSHGGDPAGEFAEVQVSGGRSLFVVSSAALTGGYVVASSLYLAEDDLSYGEPSTIDAPELEDRVVRSGYFPS